MSFTLQQLCQTTGFFFQLASSKLLVLKTEEAGMHFWSRSISAHDGRDLKFSQRISLVLPLGVLRKFQYEHMFLGLKHTYIVRAGTGKIIIWRTGSHSLIILYLSVLVDTKVILWDVSELDQVREKGSEDEWLAENIIGRTTKIKLTSVLRLWKALKVYRVTVSPR